MSELFQFSTVQDLNFQFRPYFSIRRLKILKKV